MSETNNPPAPEHKSTPRTDKDPLAFCANCGTGFKEKSKFCGGCGGKREESGDIDPAPDLHERVAAIETFLAPVKDVPLASLRAKMDGFLKTDPNRTGTAPGVSAFLGMLGNFGLRPRTPKDGE